MSKTIRNLKRVCHLEGKPTYKAITFLAAKSDTDEKNTLGKSVSEYKAILKHSVTPAGNTNKRDDTGAETI